MKRLEPLVERLPVVKALGCALYMTVAEEYGRS